MLDSARPLERVLCGLIVGYGGFMGLINRGIAGYSGGITRIDWGYRAVNAWYLEGYLRNVFVSIGDGCLRLRYETTIEKRPVIGAL